MKRKTAHVNLFFPAVGGEGTLAAINVLRQDWPVPSKLRIIGADTDPDKAPLARVDRFFVAPRRDDPTYLDFLLDVCCKEEINVVWPNPVEEQKRILAWVDVFAAKRIRVLLPPPLSVDIFHDKLKTYEYAAKAGIESPRSYAVQNLHELHLAAAELGYPERPVVFRRRSGKGAIGVYVLTESTQVAHNFFDRQFTESRLPIAALEACIGTCEEWPPCMVSEYLPGQEFDVDCLCLSEGLAVGVPRRIDGMWGGTNSRAETIDRPDLVATCERLLHAVGWQYVCNVQFRENTQGLPVLLEVNGRIPASIGHTRQAGCNLPLAALLHCLGEHVPHFPTPEVGVRLVRYFGDSYLKKDESRTVDHDVTAWPAVS